MGWGGKIDKVLINSFTIGHGFLSACTKSGEGSGAICRSESINKSFALSEAGGETAGKGVACADRINREDGQCRDRKRLALASEDERLIRAPGDDEVGDP